MDEPIKTIFIGTPEFGVNSLKSLIESGNFIITHVISQPDKKIGRKHTLTHPPIKKIALKNKIPVLQPEKISSFSDEIKKLAPDLIVVIAYAQIIPGSILDIPRFGCVNVHGSLLPRHRGASCIQGAILSGDKHAGITIMKMDEGLDSGPLIAKEKITIERNDTAGTLYERLSELSGARIVGILNKYIAGNIKPIAQDSSLATNTKLLNKADGKVDWNNRAAQIDKFVRAMTPWPGAYSKVKIDKKEFGLKFLQVSITNQEANQPPGTFYIDNKRVYINTIDKMIEIKKLQPAGKKILTAKEFVCGYCQ
ncbi:methionyl-tRNA formyltransferase [bacterium]|nr:methionyl-tRNA formyltransferase [bacterium]